MRHLSLCLLLCALCLGAQGQRLINLTPVPASLTDPTANQPVPATLTLPAEFAVSVAKACPADFAAEAQLFADALAASAPLKATVVRGKKSALVQVSADATLGEEAYRLHITAKRIEVAACDAAGLFYAFQTVKKLLPPHVAIGAKDPAVRLYALPCVSISDAPRFHYRGFMLDVSRHFFGVDEVKRLLDIMACYKLNRFHWHLTDDHGWRMEVKKYPKLTTVGATASNSKFTDMKTGQYFINRPYGPYFYTQQQMRDVVAYARARHIEVVPEVDMPGHFVAAMKAYPEYSTYPEGEHQLWINPGVSEDILNVANPKAVQFAKDILEELMDIFPSEYVHIGGDECPTIAWKSNAQCQELYRQMGLTHWRQLQSRFIAEMAQFVQSKGRRLAVWNESITADGADLGLIKSTDARVYCWYPALPAQQKAFEMKMEHIFTPNRPFYINRKQSADPNEPVNAGKGDDTLEKVYLTEPIPAGTDPTTAATCKGVQGTFWTEYVSDSSYLEYLALPRLIAIAETAWSPAARKDFAGFVERINLDRKMLDAGGYNYGKHYMK